jgi:hypothetical protein
MLPRLAARQPFSTRTGAPQAARVFSPRGSSRVREARGIDRTCPTAPETPSMNATSAARFVHVPAGLLSSVRRALVDDRPPLEAVTRLRQVGYELGSDVFDGLRERLEREGGDWAALEPEAFWRAAAEFFDALGWGTVEQRDLHPALGAADLMDWIEAESDGGPPGSHLTTGIFSGLLERMAGEPVSVMEVPTGDAGRSRLIFGRGDVLAAVYESIRDGASLDEAVERLG